MFDRVELWTVRGEVVEVKPTQIKLPANAFRFTVSAQPIPYNLQRAFDFSSQFEQEPEKVFRLGIVRQQLEIQVTAAAMWC